VTDVLVYTVASRVRMARTLLGAACQATGLEVRLEQYGSGSLYQRLGPRRAQPLPDLVLWFGAYAAQAAASDGLLLAHQPARVAEAAAHHPDWLWTTLDYSSIGVTGSVPVAGMDDLAAVPRLAVADPERSEAGLNILLATLDRARQVDSDPERGWAWWLQRAAKGLAVTEDEVDAVGMVAAGEASHALSMRETSVPLGGLPLIPHAVGLAAGSRNVDAARRLLDWLTGGGAAASMRLSPWQATTQSLLSAAPLLDVEWGWGQYTRVRRRWAQSGFGPRLTG
jgi:ABC-type Fe3+ transport system substrate-binding protein